MNFQSKQKGAAGISVMAPLGAVAVLVFVIAYFFYGLQPNVRGGVVERQFSIEKGESFKNIGAELADNGIIKSKAIFNFYSLLAGKVKKFQPGVYSVSNAMSIPQVVDVLTSRVRRDVLVTIPEGLTTKDIESVLSENGVLAEGALVNYDIQKLKSDYPFLSSASSLEGFLFPDSYFFDLNSSSDAVVRRIIDNFSKKAWPILSAAADWGDRLILASFLEREVKGFEDRQTVAGILVKRIARGMPLQVDATISYAKCGGKTTNCQNIKVYRADLDYSSPYNTYKHAGWTPTPISNPGESAIKAAISPAPSPYLYYLSKPDTGETVFSRTLEEHNANRAKYL
ncbi:MAG: Aminodeoxychorismate lyase [Candidatus Jorgensenbacteria bacterium GW2011_GWA2_45_9]|uniref:Endolytic murein transglycosylase n=1 Tax=Candidatus Jorgensenbacteria bacterium GW2011_GWA2_45_9 TaxID=1618663 RepID=A0A0G1N5G0_9BACT|nr:MAG: Aminodeoxychorismate lyase [Candidatus Jorgensenbacteria bacterium GW2011_GWA2_45_9]